MSRLFITCIPMFNVLRYTEIRIHKIDLKILFDKIKEAEKIFALDLFSSMFLSAFQINHYAKSDEIMHEWMDELIIINLYNGDVYLINYIIPKEVWKEL